MNATERLKAAQNATTANILNFDLRKELRNGLRDTGKFTDVRAKYDSRRGHLNLTVRSTTHTNKSEQSVIAFAATKNLRIALEIVSSDYYETTYRVKTLTHISAPVAPTVPAAPAAPTAKPGLAAAMKAEQTTPAPTATGPKTKVYFGYDLIGSVSAGLAKQIKAMIEAENKPKFEDVVVVDIKTSTKVSVTVPYDVAQAVKAQVPSFNQGVWSIKSTNGISILKQNAGSATEQVWVIA